VHGAGRVMSRSEAKGKRNRKTGEVIREGRVSPEAMQAWLRQKGVHLVGGDLDEAPQAIAASPTCSRITTARSRSSTGCARSSC